MNDKLSRKIKNDKLSMVNDEGNSQFTTHNSSLENAHNSQLKKGYKQTEVGVIPNDWKIEPLSEIAHFENGKAHEQFIDKQGDYVVVNSKFISTEGRVRKHSNKNIFPLKKGDITIVMSDIPKGKALAKCFLIDQENKYTLNQRIGGITANEDTDNKYLFYKLNRNKYYLAFDSGTGQTNIKRHEILDCPVALPPTKAEQTAIATALSDMDALIEGLEKLLVKKRNIKQGAMQELLSPTAQIMNGELSMMNDKGNSQMKEGWVEKKLGEIAEIKMGQSPKSEFYNNSNIGLPLIQGNADIKNRETIIRNYTSQITKKCKVGDIIMSVRAPVGEVAKAIFDACIGRGVCAISYPNQFLFQYLLYIEPLWAKHSTGSTFDSVNSDTVKNLEIPLPPTKQEQTRIAQILTDMDNEIEQLEMLLSKYKMIKTGMMQELLTGKKRIVNEKNCEL